MIIYLICCFITGLMIINLIKQKINLLDLIILSLPIGIIFHTLIFTVLVYLKIYYGIELFITLSLSTLLILIFKRIKIEKDLKEIPIYYVIFLVFIITRLIIMANTGYFEFYNFDELTAYQTNSKIMFISHDYSQFYSTYAPMNYFVGIMSYEFNGFDLSAPRLITPLFFGIMSLFIYSSLRDNKTNKHISALIAILFLISSSELLQLSKGFYSNIFFMVYYVIGIYGVLNHFLVKNEKRLPIIFLIILFGAMLTRAEALYFVPITITIISLILLLKKKINIKKLLLLIGTPIAYFLIWKQMIQINVIQTASVVSENVGTTFDIIFDRLKLDNLKSYLNNIFIQTLSNDYYYFNYLVFSSFIVAIIIVIVKLIKKHKSPILTISIIMIILQLIYIGIIVYTQFTMFMIGEYLVAASFSRYIIALMPINFILIGILLFSNSETMKKEKMIENDNKLEKLVSPKVILIIPAYNEEKNILNTYKSIEKFNKKSKLKYDVIVVNDGSADMTKEVLTDNSISHINLIRNLGIGGAVQTGYKYAYRKNYDIAVQFDGDGQHDINCVKNIINPIIQGKSEMVIGSRFLDKNNETFKSSFVRRIGISLISLTMKIVTKKQIYDTTSGFRACNKKIIEEFSHDYPVEYPEPISTVGLVKRDYIVSEVSVKMSERLEGKSSIHSWKTMYYMVNVFMSIIVVGIRRKK